MYESIRARFLMKARHRQRCCQMGKRKLKIKIYDVTSISIQGYKSVII